MLKLKMPGLLILTTLVTCFATGYTIMIPPKEKKQDDSMEIVETWDSEKEGQSNEITSDTDSNESIDIQPESNSLENHETTDSPSEKIDYSGYDELIAKARKILKNPDSEYSEESEFSSVLFMKSEYETFGYLIKDLDCNGINELIIGANTDGWDEGSWDGVIYNIYTIVNGEVVQVLNGWERNRYYLCENGSIANEGSSSAFESNNSYYKYSGSELTLIESVIFNSTIDENNPWYYSTESEYDIEKAESISKEKANEIMNKYKHVKLKYTPFIS